MIKHLTLRSKIFFIFMVMAAITVAGGIIMLWYTYKIDNMLVSFILALVTSYILEPFVNFIESKNVPRSLSITLTYLITFSIIIIVGAVVFPMLINQIYDLRLEIPKYIVGTTKFIKDFEDAFTNWSGSYIQINIHDEAAHF